MRRSVVVDVNPLWYRFARIVVLPINLARSPSSRSSRPTLPSFSVSVKAR